MPDSCSAFHAARSSYTASAARVRFKAASERPAPSNAGRYQRERSAEPYAAALDLVFDAIDYGLPPGTRYIGNLSLPAGGGSTLDFTADYLEDNPLAFDDIVILTCHGVNNSVFSTLDAVGGVKLPVDGVVQIAPDDFVLQCGARQTTP